MVRVRIGENAEGCRRVFRRMRMRRHTLSILAQLAVVALSACATTVDRAGEVAALEALHASVLEAHRRGDVGAWMAHEADTVVSANRGVISFPSAEERRTRRERYLSATTFDVYRDLRPPIVTVSEDGTLGWVIAEVEIKGTISSEGGERTPVEGIWAWIELYEKQEGVWKAVGNVSNRRP